MEREGKKSNGGFGMRKFIILFVLFSLKLTASVVHISELPEDMQKMVVPDMEGRVLINDLDSQFTTNEFLTRDLPTVVAGWPVSYTGSNCKNGAIYVNMDTDPEAEILFGVGTKITALNLDGTVVPGWPKQLAFYIWSSPAAGDIDGDGEMEIVCTSRNNSNANSGELYAFELDGTPCAGFPVVQAGGGTNNACLFDLDGNGDMEILVNVRNHPQGWVYVFDGDGSVYPGFPQELDYIPGAGISAGDITGDGIPEVVALSYNMLHVFDLQGNILPGFPVANTGYNYSYSQPILFDLDNDGLNEIIWGGCSSAAGAVFAVNQDGSSVTGWPQTTGQWIFGTVALGDIDQDGSMDVVVGDQVGSGTPMDYIYAWDSAGNDLAGFPAGPTNAIYAQVGIADLDGDGFVELMIDDNNFGFGYNAYNHDGTQCVDWPLPCGTIWSSTTMQITPVFGDVDNDNEIEIIGAATDIMGWVVECYLWETGTTWNEDLAYMIVDGCNIQHNGLYAPSVPATFDPPENVMVNDETGLVTWLPPATMISEDNFDSYTVGDYLGVVNPALWTTWSNAPGGPEDVVVTDAQAASPVNSILVELNNDCVMIMDDYTSGVYSMDIDMYVPTGYCGYYNMQKTSTPGQEWGFEIYLQTDGTAILNAGAASAASFQFSHNEWIDLRLVIDLDNDFAEFFYNGTSIIGYQWTLGIFGTPGLLQLGGMDIWGGANSGTTDTPMFYVDNVEFKEIVLADDLTGYNVYLDTVFQGYTMDLEYLLTGLEDGTEYTAGVSAVYDDPGESEIITCEFTYSPVTTFDPPANLAVVSNPNDNFATFTWDAPVAPLYWQDDMDSYTAGQYLALQSPDWTTWSGTPGGSEDGYVVDENSYSGANSVKVQGTTTDLVHEFGTFTEGVYEVSMMMYIVTGYGGYYNLLHYFNGASSEWGMEVYFGSTGTGSLCATLQNITSFAHPVGSWFEVMCIIDLDADWAEFYVDGTFVYDWQWSIDTIGNPGSCEFGAIDIYASAATGSTPMFFCDDVTISAIVAERDLTGYNVYLDDVMQDFTTETEWIFTDLTNGTIYTAAVEAVYDDGVSELIELDFEYMGLGGGNIIIAATTLKGNYPNPFNPETNIAYSVKEAGKVSIEVYNLRGQLVKTLVDGVNEAGDHIIVWNGTNEAGKSVASGVYFYKMKANKFVSTKKMILMK